MESFGAETLLTNVLVKPSEWKIISALAQPDLRPVEYPHRDKLIRNAKEHVHPFRQITIILDGVADCILSGKIYRCVPATFVFADPLETHFIQPVDRWQTLLVLRINIRQGRIFTRLWQLRSDEPDRSSLEDIFLPIGLGRTIDKVWTELHDQKGPNTLVRRAKLMYATGLLISDLLDAQTINRRRCALSPEELLAAVVDLLDYDLGQGVSLDALAELTGYSSGHFARLFREYTGKTVYQYVEQRRIESARSWAENGMSPKGIAARMGFSSLSAFYHWWAKKIGGTPGETARSSQSLTHGHSDQDYHRERMTNHRP